MSNQHPIVPPPELVQEWYEEAKRDLCGRVNWVALKAAQWGADQELEACCEWVVAYAGRGDALHAARRPKPPSLAENALSALEMHFAAIGEGQCYQPAHKIAIRRALERLQQLENNQ